MITTLHDALAQLNDSFKNAPLPSNEPAKPVPEEAPDGSYQVKATDGKLRSTRDNKPLVIIEFEVGGQTPHAGENANLLLYPYGGLDAFFQKGPRGSRDRN